MDSAKIKELWQGKNCSSLSNKVITTISRQVELWISEGNVKSLDDLTDSGYVQQYLWKHFHKDCTLDHIISLLNLINYNAKLLSIIINDHNKFRYLLFRALSIFKNKEQSQAILNFMILLVDRLSSSNVIRTLLTPVFSIVILDNEQLTQVRYKILNNKELQQLYTESVEEFNNVTTDEDNEIKYLSKTWLTDLIFQFNDCTDLIQLKLTLKLLIKIVSFLPSRMFVNQILKELNFVCLLRAHSKGKLLDEDLINLLQYLVYYPIDHFSGEINSLESLRLNFINKFSVFQSFLLKYVGNTNNRLFNFDLDYDNLKIKLKFMSVVESLNLSCKDLKSLLNEMNIIVSLFSDSSLEDKDLLLTILWYNVGDLFSNYEIEPFEVPGLTQDHGSNFNMIDRNYISFKDLQFDLYNRKFNKLVNQLKEHVLGVSKKNKSIYLYQLKSEIVSLENNNRKLFELKLDSNKRLFDITLDLKGYSHQHQAGWNSLESGSVLYFVGNDKATGKDFYIPLKLLKISSSNSKNSKTKHLTVSVPSNTENMRLLAMYEISERKDVIRLNKEHESTLKALESFSNFIVDSTDSQIPEWFADILLGINNERSLNDEPAQLDLNCNISYDNLAKSFDIRDDVQHAKKKRKTTESGISEQDTKTIKLFENGTLLSYNYNSKQISKVEPYDNLDESSQNEDIVLNRSQLESIFTSLNNNFPLSIINGCNLTGKSILVNIITKLVNINFGGKSIVVTNSIKSKEKIIRSFLKSETDEIIRLCLSPSVKGSDFTELQLQFLDRAQCVADLLKIDGYYKNDLSSSLLLYERHIKPLWKNFTLSIRSASRDDVLKLYPFKEYDLKEEFIDDNGDKKLLIKLLTKHYYNRIVRIFKSIEFLELFKFVTTENVSDRANQILELILNYCNFSVFTKDELLDMNNTGFEINCIILYKFEDFDDYDLLNISRVFNTKSLRKLIILGNIDYLSTNKQNFIFKKIFESNYSKDAKTDLTVQYNVRPEIYELYKDVTKTTLFTSDDNTSNFSFVPNAGLLSPMQLVNVSSNDSENSKTEYQNIEQAEYCVALFMYMKLLNYPSNVTIVTNYKIQRILIEEILRTRCSNNKEIFGNTTPEVKLIEEINGYENENVIVSLVNHKVPNFIEALKLSQSSTLGLYIFSDVSNLMRLKSKNGVNTVGHVFTRLLKSPDARDDLYKLHLVGNEMFDGEKRQSVNADNDKDKFPLYTMESYEHFGNYVYEMTKTKIESLK
ncbi:hypothetical protein B5S30_g1357 [[Candida] boidinii]|nr:hypothetical protein B5S30_g1357 [[Candida] boidinii]